MFKICSNSYALGDTCPPDYTVRNVWRASPFGSFAPLGTPCGRPGRQERPRTPERPPQATIWAAYVFHQCAADLTLERLLLTFRGVRRP